MCDRTAQQKHASSAIGDDARTMSVTQRLDAVRFKRFQPVCQRSCRVEFDIDGYFRSASPAATTRCGM
jgi:hypothetical protein